MQRGYETKRPLRIDGMLGNLVGEKVTMYTEIASPL